MNNKRGIIWILALILIALSIFLYFEKSSYWYNYLVIGMLFLFDNLSHLRKNKTTLDLLFSKKYKQFLLLFFYLFIAGLLIELIGHFWLGFWHYSFINPPSEHIIANIIGFLMYPLTLMFFREMFNFIHSFIKSGFLSVIYSMILGVIMWEIPNVFSQDWIYFIPLIDFKILGVNIMVFLGWSILILLPLWIYKLAGVPSR